MPSSVPLIHIRRGGLVESVHHGSFVLMEGDEVIAAAGDPGHVEYFRSTAKPFQAMVAITSGAVERFGLTPEELALAAGSHNAEPRHVEVARGILAKAGIDEAALGCGGHWSINPERAREQVVEVGADADPLPRVWSNCSGKHAIMLAAARAMDAPLDAYLQRDHPVQQEITATLAAFSGVASNDIPLGTDGCGAPAHALSTEAMARALVRLGDPTAMDAPYVACANQIADAMAAHPDMVGGTKRFDTDLMTSSAVGLLAKAGAEGIHGVTVPSCRLGLAVQVDDGSDRGYRQLVIELLLRRGVLTDDEAAGLRERHGATIKNWMGDEVGRLEVAV